MSSVKEQVAEILKELSPEEMQLLNRVLRIEQEKLHQDKPHVKEDLLRAVREIVK